MMRPTIASNGDSADTGGGRPAGLPVGRALAIRPGLVNDDLRVAVAAIGRVHGDGDLPTIPMFSVGNLVNNQGRSCDGLLAFEVTGDGSVRSLSIAVRIGAPHRQLVALHEVGHFLDASGLPGLMFTSSDLDDDVLLDWHEAVAQSDAVGDLRELAKSSRSAVRAHALRLLAAEELWARSYTQFVVGRAGDDRLRASLAALRGDQTGAAGSAVYYPRHWADDDFASIDSAMERLFRRLEWID